jgi:signal transduction histidine kinase/DNA-binding response OmpR family regulator
MSNSPAFEAKPDFETLFEAVPALYLVLTPDFTIVAVSSAYLRATMTRREEILGRGIFEVFPDNPDDPAASGTRNLRTSLERVRQHKTADTMAVQKYDIRRPAAEGGGFEERYWSPINCPVLGPDQQLHYIIHRVEDVTDFIRLKQRGQEQDQLAAELRGHAEQVETELYLRAQEVQQANLKLVEANQELARLYEQTKELDAIKTRFFSNISHELRTPLTLILGPAERLLANPKFDTESRRQLEVISRNARTLLHHVNDLLDITKMESGMMTPAYTQLDLARWVRLTASHFEVLAAERGITLLVDAPPTLPAQVDAEKMQRVLLNLLSNAFKFVPNNGRVACRLRADSGRIRITVDDNGPGVPIELREVIFERFRQGEEGATRRYGGTGLGLAIVKEFLQLQTGTIKVGESPDGGARFEVEMPQQAPAGTKIHEDAGDIEPSVTLATQLIQTRQPQSPEVISPEDPQLPLILVVEDNKEVNRFIGETLSSHYRVSCAYDGREGLVRALALKPDLIVTDIMMPKMSGDQLVRELRLHKVLDATPILLLSAKTDEALRVELLRKGAQDYLTKPFLPDELTARVGNLLKGVRHYPPSERSEYVHALEREITGLKSQLKAALLELEQRAIDQSARLRRG